MRREGVEQSALLQVRGSIAAIGSVKDQVNRLEARVDEIYLLLCEKK